MAKFIGIDYGMRRVGIAISDDSGKIALPLKTIEGNDFIFLNSIKEIIAEKGIEKIVLGLPLNLSGEESPMSQKVRKFAEKLNYNEMTIIFWDERLTTTEAHRALHEMNKKPSHHRKDIDLISATLILQSYLDSINPIEDA